MPLNKSSDRIPLDINAFVDPVIILDPLGRIEQISPSCRKIFALEGRDLRGRPFSDFLPRASQLTFTEFLKTLRDRAGAKALELELESHSGAYRPVELSLSALKKAGRLLGFQGVIKDLKPLRQASERFLEQRRRLALMGEIGESLQVKGRVREFIPEILHAALSLGHFSLAAAYQLDSPRRLERVAHIGSGGLFPEQISEESPPLLPERFFEYPRMLDSGNPIGRPRLLKLLEEKGLASALILPLQSRGQLQGIILLAARESLEFDDDERLFLRQLGDILGQALENLELSGEVKNLDARFKALTESSTDHIWETDVGGNYTYNSPSLQLLLGYEPQEARGRHPLEFIHPEDRSETKEYLLTLIEEKKAIRGLVSRTINKRGETVYVESRAFPIFNSRGEVTGYRGLDRNISDWFESKRVLEETLMGTCEALSRMVELRDPYTKGHSVRVAEIMVLIGKALGRTEYDIQGLRLMGLLHDIGKIGIPTEILSKPSRLSSEEIELMRQHPEMGFEILKDINFPWPVGAAVLQHHERLDGSGYPQGLVGDDIIWQVRLLAIADLLEAMATDRPYRPGLGLDMALRELRENREILYDAEIVDAVLDLASEGGLDTLFEKREPTPPASTGAAPRIPRVLSEAVRHEEIPPPSEAPDTLLLTLRPRRE